jgi:hypothetical protein
MDVTELPSFGQTIRMAMRLDPSIYRAVVHAPDGLRVALFIVALASFSEALGQSVVLFINNVRPRRFALALGISALSNAIGYLLWVGVIWLIMRFPYQVEAPLVALASAVGLAYAPQLLGFFELLPYWGNPFGIILSLWTMLAITVAIDANLGLSIWQAAVASAMGWALIQLWRRSLGVPLYALGEWLQRRIAGSPMQFNIKDIPDLRRRFEIMENVDNWRELLSRAKWEEFRERVRTEGIQFNLSRRTSSEDAQVEASKEASKAASKDAAEENEAGSKPAALLAPPTEKTDSV